MMVLGARIGVRGVGCMSEISMKNVCGINSIMNKTLNYLISESHLRSK
jgi:hypothetical protein